MHPAPAWDFERGASRSWPVRRHAPRCAQKVGQRLTVAADSANRRRAAKSEAATAIGSTQPAVLGIQKVGRGRTVSRVLYPSRDDDHLSATPVARRLLRPLPEGSASSLIALLFGLAPGGVCLAGRSPGRRWALTPPFHPYRQRSSGDD